MNTVLVTVDALRADHLAQYGYDRNTMPVLDELASEGTLFTSAYSNGPYTRISVPSFHTSKLLGYISIEETPTIASVLSQEGIHTCGIGTQTGFAPIESDLVFDNFIDLGRDGYHRRANEPNTARRSLGNSFRSIFENVSQYCSSKLESSSTMYEIGKKSYRRINWLVDSFEYLGYHSAESVTDSAIEWLDSHREDDFFLWIHYMEGHRPYGVHDTEQQYTDEATDEEEIMQLMKTAGTRPNEVTVREHRTIGNLYDSDLRYCSSHISRLFDELNELGIWDETNVIFTSDHGEEFYDHGYFFHRNLPYDELIHVPLIAKTASTSGETCDDQRELLDLAPTICQLHDMDSSSLPFLGQPLFEGNSRKVMSIGSQLYLDDPIIAVRWDGWKYIHTADADLLFDVENDPGERQSVTQNYPDVAERMRSEIPERLLTREREQLLDPHDQVDKQRLEALGYLELDD